MGFNWWSLAPQNWGADLAHSAENTFLTVLNAGVQAFAYIVNWLLYAAFSTLGFVLNFLNIAAGSAGLFAMPVFFTLFIGLMLTVQVLLGTMKDIPVVGAVV
jgi:hypothetical protein